MSRNIGDHTLSYGEESAAEGTTTRSRRPSGREIQREAERIAAVESVAELLVEYVGYRMHQFIEDIDAVRSAFLIDSGLAAYPDRR
jgi:hypothetical protein